jgi:glycosyltransferase involved in cell wall biosynthesis
MKPTASVIIPTHNAATVLGEQLGALAAQAGAPPFEVLVVLNRCADDSGSAARAFQSQLSLTIVEANEKLSAAYARNVGAACTAAPHLLFCDADDRVGPRWVREMVRAMSDTDADYVGGHPIVDRCNLQNWIYNDFYRETDAEGLNLHYPGLRYPITASFGVTRDAFEAVGGFDESFPGTGHEEIDLTLRLGRSGCRVGIAPEAELLYRPRRTFRGLMKQRRGYAIGGAYSLLKERTPIIPQSPFEETRLLARMVARRILREKQWRPNALAAGALDHWYRYYLTQRLPNDRLSGPEPQPVLDFTVDPMTPVIGGLTFLAPASQAYRHATEGVEPVLVTLVDELLRPGDVFVDHGADIGAVTVCAAVRVGTSGRVIAVEPESRARELIVQNTARHRVADLVSIMSMMDIDTLDGGARVNMARINAARPASARSSPWHERDGWTVWMIDEQARTVTKRRAADDQVKPCTSIALPTSRDEEVEATIDRRHGGSKR